MPRVHGISDRRPIFGRRRILDAVFFLLLPALLIGFLRNVLASRDADPREPPDQSTSAYWEDGPLVEGLLLTSYTHDRPSLRVGMDAVSVKAGKVGFFKIGFLQVAEIKNLEMDLFFYENFKDPRKKSSQPAGWSHISQVHEEFPAQSLRKLPGVGLVERVDINGVRCNILVNTEKVSTLSAETPDLDEEGTAQFQNEVELHTVSGKTLRCERLLWRWGEEEIRVEGPYLLQEGDHARGGMGILETDLKLNRIHYLSNKIM
jgi:hypothetical protein